jgi:phage terminase large subunit GpA-like protein
MRFKLDRHPAARLFFRELETGRWQRTFWTGPNQDGKTLILTIVLMYLLFERCETATFGVPSNDMASDKWKVDLLPVINCSRYQELLPTRGAGSRGGDPLLVEFAHGPNLRFMTAGGDDQSRAGFTSPNLVVTEADGFDEVGSSSREGDKFSQLERRTLAFGEDARLYAECTVTIEQGRVWREYQQGTRSRIALPCPHCSAWVTPDREHLFGWQAAHSEVEAEAQSHLVCPECGVAWSNEQRIEANHRAVLVHRGQEVDPDGNVTGDLPATNTFGFRWTAVNSVMNPKRLSRVASKEWRVKLAADEDAADRDVRQSEWALPHEPDAQDLSAIEWQSICRRVSNDPRGRVPSDTEQLVFAVDLGKRLLHWILIAFRADDSPHVVDYGRHEVASDELGEEPALRIALRDLRDNIVAKGWDSDLGPQVPQAKLVDTGNWTDLAYAFCSESGPDWIPCKGFGVEQRGRYSEPRQTSRSIAFIGEGYYIARLPKKRVKLCEVNADHAKSRLHASLSTPVGKPGAMTLFNAPPQEHTSIAKHFTAERKEQRFVPGRGSVTAFRAMHRNNHYLDAAALAGVGAHLAKHWLVRFSASYGPFGKAAAAAARAGRPFPAQPPQIQPEELPDPAAQEQAEELEAASDQMPAAGPGWFAARSKRR